jgi:hypothetical protein
MDMMALKAWCDELGVNETTGKSWKKNYWEKGVHYVLAGKTTLIKKDAVELWLNEGCRKDSPNETLVSEFVLPSKAKPTQKTLKAPVTKLTSPLA